MRPLVVVAQWLDTSCWTVIGNVLLLPVVCRREWWEKFDLEAPGNNDGYIDVQELTRIGEALQKKHNSFLGAGETVEAWADRLMYENHTGWLVPYREQPVCSIMQGQCTVSDDPEEDNCDMWVEEGHCITHFNATLGVDIE